MEGGSGTREDNEDLQATVTRLREDIAKCQDAVKLREDRDLQLRWQGTLRTFRAEEGRRIGNADYPRMGRLFDIVREDGKTRMMLGYDQYNPEPDFANEGQRHQVEKILRMEQPLVRLMEEAGSRWRAGDLEGEAALLEEYAISNPQKEAILDLAWEARSDALSGASASSRPKRR